MFHFSKKIYTYALLLICFVSFLFVYHYLSHNTRLQVVFLDVGQGDATLIITPEGRTVLIDAGKYPGIGGSIADYVPWHDRDIDILIATHPDLDHIGGIDSLLNDYQVHLFGYSGFPDDALVYRNIFADLEKQETSNFIARSGQRIVLGKNVYLDVLSPYDDLSSVEKNEHSVVLLLSYYDTQFLLMGDASIENEKEIGEIYGTAIQSDVLKLGHHGSQTSSSSLFLDSVNPAYGIVSAGCNNTFGHPHQSVLSRLFARNIKILETCRDGDIVFETDGKELWYKS